MWGSALKMTRYQQLLNFRSKTSVNGTILKDQDQVQELRQDIANRLDKINKTLLGSSSFGAFSLDFSQE